jgi:hypothetical protein
MEINKFFSDKIWQLGDPKKKGLARLFWEKTSTLLPHYEEKLFEVTRFRQ